MLNISNIDYTIGYDAAAATTGEKVFESRGREGTPIIKWIRYMLYKELERMKNRFKIIVTIDTTTGDISSRLDADKDCKILGIEWK